MSNKRKPPHLRTKWYVRESFQPEEYEFLYRIFGLSMVQLYFGSYDELAQYPDAKYATDVYLRTTILVDRLHSLNRVGDMFWPEHLPDNFAEFPLSRYEWLMVASDSFLMRYISVVDCASLLANEVLELGLKQETCTIGRLEREGLPTDVLRTLKTLRSEQGHFRAERNQRIHHGIERSLSSDHFMLKVLSGLERRSRSLVGLDYSGRKLDVRRSFNEGLVELQRDFNGVVRLLGRRMGELYGALSDQFEIRFHEKFHSPGHAPVARSTDRSLRRR